MAGPVLRAQPVRLVGPALAGRRGERREAGQVQPPRGPEREVEAPVGLASVARAAIGEHGAHEAARSHVALDAQCAEVGARIAESLVLQHAQEAYRLAPRAARQPDAAQHRHLALVLLDPDAARKEEQERWRLEQRACAELEDTRVLEEELALLGQEQVEARQVHDLVVGFHLREVGVGGEVEHEAGAHLPLGVGAHRRVVVARQRAVVLPLQVRAHEAVRLQLQVQARVLEAGKAQQVARPAHAVEPALGAGPRAPQRLLALPANEALHVEAPRLGAVVRRVAQAAKRDRELRRPALGRAARGDPPHRAPVGVVARALVAHQRLELRAVRVGGEQERVPVVVERVDQDRDAVVARPDRPVVEARLQQPVALQDPADHPLRLAVERAHADVERRVVVQHAHLGRLARRLALLRLALPEARGRLGQRPRRLVEDTVDLQRRLHAQGRHGRLRRRLCGGEGDQQRGRARSAILPAAGSRAKPAATCV